MEEKDEEVEFYFEKKGCTTPYNPANSLAADYMLLS